MQKIAVMFLMKAVIKNIMIIVRLRVRLKWKVCNYRFMNMDKFLYNSSTLNIQKRRLKLRLLWGMKLNSMKL